MRNNKSNDRPYQKRPYRNRIDILGDEIPTMYKATCDNCGKSCEVPFRPSNGKPVYCNDCFGKMKDGGNFKGKTDRGNFSRSDFDSKQMFKAICDNCGRSCEVPFKPSNNKPVYCSDCFEKQGNTGRNRQGTDNHKFEEQLEAINAKLDRLLNILTSSEG